MASRAQPSGITLDADNASLIKGMLARGDRQHDIAAWFGVNGGRIAEVASGMRFSWVSQAEETCLPPQGPYPCGRDALDALKALSLAKKALIVAEEVVRNYSR